MDWQEIISMVLQSVLVPLLIYGATLLRNYLKVKAKSDQVRLVLDQAYEAAVFGVSVTAQKFVDEIKGTDKWDQAQMQEAAWRARQVARQVMGEKAYELLDTITGSADEWLQAAIEDAVRDDKR